MEVESKDVALYQIVDCLVEKYDYNVIRFNGQKKDLWLTNTEHSEFPIIRISAEICNSVYFEMQYLNTVKNYMSKTIQLDANVLIINTNNESSEFEENGYRQVLLNDSIESILLFSTFPELKNMIQQVDNKEQEVKRIFRNLESYRFKKFREQSKQNRASKLTTGIIGFLVVVYGLTFILSTMLETKDANASQVVSLIMLGGYYKTFIVAANEYWRLLTSGFLHISVMHLLINCLALYSLAQLVEKNYKKWQYICILVGSIVLGSVFNFIFDDNIIAVGISGGLYGLLGAYIVTTIDNQSIRIPQVRSSIFRVLLMNILISLLPGISLYAHLGGFVAGCILGFLFLSNKRLKEFTIHITASSLLLVVGLGFFMFQNTKIYTVNKPLDDLVVREIRTLGLTQYADHLESSLVKFYDANRLK